MRIKGGPTAVVEVWIVTVVVFQLNTELSVTSTNLQFVLHNASIY